MFEDAIKQGQELFIGLNWTFIYMFAFVIYGIKMEDEFKWYNTWLHRNATAYSLRLWIAGLIIAFLNTIFHCMEIGTDKLDVYVASLLRSFIITIVFNSVVIQKVKQLMKKINDSKQ